MLTKADNIPDPIPAILADAVQNLRSSLDHIVWQLIEVNGGTPKRCNSFPIAESRKEYVTAEFRRKLHGMHPRAIEIVNSFKPYKEGNKALWWLHRLNNIAKHRLVLSAVSALTDHHLLPSQRKRFSESFLASNPAAREAPDLKGVFIAADTTKFPLKVGEVFLSIPRSEMENDFTFQFGIAFNEPGVVVGEPVVDAVQNIAEVVEALFSKLGPLLS